MSVSVAMVTFNGERFVGEQLASILSQLPPPDEIVIGDDGSVDGTVTRVREIAAHTDVPVRVLTGDHRGLRLNIERTLEACHGSVIVLADQDDVWEQGKLAAIRAAFAEPGLAMWFSDALLVDATNHSLERRLWEVVTLPEASRTELEEGRALRRMIHGQTVTGATMAISSSVLRTALPLPKELEHGDHLYLHDGWFAVLASLLGGVVADPVPYTRYRQHADQVTWAGAPTPVDPRTDRERALEDMRTELARVSLVLERLEASGHAAQCRPDDITELREVRHLLGVRTLPLGPQKWWQVTRALRSGSYRRHARGWRTAAADIFAVRGAG